MAARKRLLALVPALDAEQSRDALGLFIWPELRDGDTVLAWPRVRALGRVAESAVDRRLHFRHPAAALAP